MRSTLSHNLTISFHLPDILPVKYCWKEQLNSRDITSFSISTILPCCLITALIADKTADK